MARQLVLWGPPIVPSEPGESAYERDVEAWVDRLHQVGVTKNIPGTATPVLIEAAHKKGILVHPYVNYTAFPSYGIRNLTYGWSLAFLRPNVDAPGAREIMDRHRPVWNGPQIGEETLEPFAQQHPEFWSLTRDKSQTLEPGERRCMSLAFPEVRANQIQKFLDAFEASGGDGLQMELVLGNEDENKVATYGYEDAVANAFQEKHGKSPFDIPNNDPDWMQFRADYVTSFLSELRDAIRKNYPGVQFNTTMIAGDPDDYIKVLQDWPAWVEQGLVDELYVWWRTNSDLKDLERQTKHVAEVVNGRCPFIAELACYHPGSFQQPELMLEGARIAKANGADAVGVYRTHAVDQLNFWPVLEKMAKL